MQEKDVLNYLITHPEFIAQHRHQLVLPPPKVRSFSEAEAAAAEQKIAHMSQRMQEIYDNVNANAITMNKFLKLFMILMRCTSLEQLRVTLSQALCHDFNMPNHGLFLLVDAADNSVDVPQNMRFDNATLVNKISTLSTPYLGQHYPWPELYAWLPEKNGESFLLLPVIEKGKNIAVLLIGHKDAHYFYPEAMTEYLTDLAQALAATLTRLLKL